MEIMIVILVIVAIYVLSGNYEIGRASCRERV